MDRPKDIYAPLAVQNWVEYADWLEGENEIWLETVAAHRAMLIEAEDKLEAKNKRQWQEGFNVANSALEAMTLKRNALEEQYDKLREAAQDVVAYCREDIHTLALKAELEGT
jgi:hypothetical protein